MNPVAWPAPAKLNLFLHVTGRRPDGYHTLQTVFQLLDYGDTLHFRPSLTWELHFTCNKPELETTDNLVLEAARLLQQKMPVPRGCRIHLDKHLPAGGGVGGGSSDAATTLIALNRLWEAGLTLDELAALGLQLGADVPVFIHGHSAWAEGVGEKLDFLTLPEDWFVVLTPNCHVSTARVFGHPELTRHSAPLRIRAFPFSGSKNDCESVTCMLHPEVRSALEWLGRHTTDGGDARMTGTGASVFARFRSREQAAVVLARKPDNVAGFIARGTNVSPLHSLLNGQLNK
ncbi:MAG: 4-diphosphocytidyl-2-C-methyl-D-erythritol kinase [Pseudomonadota bacterium]|jgi:4-diphosphocytidyl-2-C-methyl-D-erythritol kinase